MKNLLQKAIYFAKEKHAGQKRKGGNVPYTTHIFGVAKILEEENADLKTIIVGILHDTLEDTNTTIEELTKEFGVEIACMVDTLSEKKGLPYKDRKHMQSIRIKYSSKEVKMVKCADCLSNLTDTYKDLQVDPNVWNKFNAGKQDIQTHYQETIEALSEIKSTHIYNRLVDVYDKVFKEKQKIKYCTDCNFMKRILTPDPDDWFCDDDQMYVCGVTNKTLSECNRPYEKQVAPSDCPLEMER